MTQIEAIVEPDGVTNDVRWESVAFVCVHEPILPISGGLLGRTPCPAPPVQTVTILPLTAHHHHRASDS